MDTDRFDRATHCLTHRGPLTRRGMSGFAAGATAALPLNAEAKK